MLHPNALAWKHSEQCLSNELATLQGDPRDAGSQEIAQATLYVLDLYDGAMRR